MCLLLLAIDSHPKHRIVLAANRDEIQTRPTAPADRWSNCPNVIGGRDLEAGGTWMGVTEDSKRWAALTNVFDFERLREDAPSRGRLPKDFLCGDAPAEEYIRRVHEKRDPYNGFNLVASDGSEIWYVSTHTDEPRRLGPGIYGISNAVLDTPWPKVTRGKMLLKRRLEQERIVGRDLFSLLEDEHRPDDAHLPDIPGMPLENIRSASAMFIRNPEYATRSSLALVLDINGGGTFWERTYDSEGSPLEVRSFRLGENTA